MVIFSSCLECKNIMSNSNKRTDLICCKAYPDGIPDKVFFDASGNLCRTINKDKTHFEAIDNEKTNN